MSNLKLTEYDKTVEQAIEDAVQEMLVYIRDAGDAWRNGDVERFITARDEVEGYADSIVELLEEQLELKNINDVYFGNVENKNKGGKE